jgi:hypothetical protein
MVVLFEQDATAAGRPTVVRWGECDLFRRRRQQRRVPDLLASMTAEEQIETRFAAALSILIAAARESGAQSTAGILHLITTGEASVRAHVELLGTLCSGLGIAVARLSADDSDAVRATSYRADVVVGTLDDFVADFGRESALGITRHAAMVEGGPSATTRHLLSAYRSVGAA